MTRDDLRFLMGRMANAFGRTRKVTDELLDEWHRALAPFSVEQAHAALDRWIRITDSVGRPPNLAQLLGLINAMRPRPEMYTEPEPWDGPTERGRQLAAQARATADAMAARRSWPTRGRPA